MYVGRPFLGILEIMQLCYFYVLVTEHHGGVTVRHQFPFTPVKTTLPQKTFLALEMRSTMLRLAESVSKTPLNLQEASAALYPPIPYALFAYYSWLCVIHSCSGFLSMHTVYIDDYSALIGICHLICVL